MSNNGVPINHFYQTQSLGKERSHDPRAGNSTQQYLIPNQLSVREQSSGGSTLGTKVPKGGVRVSNMRVYNESQAARNVGPHAMKNNYLSSPSSPKSHRASSFRAHPNPGNLNEQIKSHPELLHAQVPKSQNLSQTNINQAGTVNEPPKKRKLTLTQRTINQGFNQAQAQIAIQ